MSARGVLTCVTFAAAAGLALGGAALAFYLFHDAPPCFRASKILAHTRFGEQIVFEEEVCDGFAHSMVGSLSFVTKTENSRRVFFSYEEREGSPKITWSGNNVMLVSIKSVGEIHEKRDTLGTMQIRYQIGRSK